MAKKMLMIKLSAEEFDVLENELIEANNAEQYYLDNDCSEKEERKEIKQSIEARRKLVSRLQAAWRTA